MFNVHIQSKLLWCMPVMGTGTGLHWFFCPGHEEKKGGRGQPVQAGTSSLTGVGSRQRVV